MTLARRLAVLLRATVLVALGLVNQGSGLLLLPVAAGGVPIGANRQITDAGLNGDTATSPDLFARGANLYAVWMDERDGYSHEHVYFAKSPDGGATWGTNQRISSLSYDAWVDDAVIAVQPNGNIWAFWWQFYTSGSNTVNDLRFAKSVDGGATFTTGILFDGDDAAEDLRHPVVAVDESTGRLHVLMHEYWVRGASTGFEFRLVTIGITGTMIHNILLNDVPVPGRGDNDFLENPRMSLTARNGTVCAAWEDQRSTFAVYGACSTDGGASAGANFAASEPNMERPVAALAPDGTLYVTYREPSDARKNIRMRSSTNLGQSWRPTLNLTQLGEDAVRSWDLAVDQNGQLSLAWVRTAGTSASDLYLSTSLDQGATFTLVKIEDGQGQYPQTSDQFEVSVAVSGVGADTRAHIAWSDDRNVGQQIWFQTLSIDGIPPSAPANLSAVGEDRSNRLTWSPSTDSNGVVGYKVFRSATSGGPYAEISAVLVPGTSYRDVELGAQTYYYRVAAVDGSGNVGPPSAVAQAAAIANAPLSARGTVAYVSANAIQVRDVAGGTVRTIAPGDRPRFAKDGRLLYYDAKTVWARPLASGNPVNLISKETGTPWYDVADDPTRIAMVLQRTGIAPPAAGGICFLFEPYYFDKLSEVYSGGNEQTQDIAISADGEWLAYNYRGFCNAIAVGTTTPPDLCIVKIATGTRNCLNRSYMEPDFSPVGGRLVFVAELSGQKEIWTAQLLANGTLDGLTQLTRGPVNQPAGEPNWSSDGNWIVFKRDVDPTAGVNWQLHIVRADGAGARPLNMAGESPAWSGGGSAPVVPGQARVFLPGVAR